MNPVQLRWVLIGILAAWSAGLLLGAKLYLWARGCKRSFCVNCEKAAWMAPGMECCSEKCLEERTEARKRLLDDYIVLVGDQNGTLQQQEREIAELRKDLAEKVYTIQKQKELIEGQTNMLVSQRQMLLEPLDPDEKKA